jgi:uncharacterized protein YecT (DUF1311 family)
MNRLALFAFVLILLSATAIAEDDFKCRVEGNQQELNACAADEYAAADKEMNTVYRQILKEYTDEPLFLEKLKIAQRLWLQLRDAETEARFPVGRNENPRDVWGSAMTMDVDTYRAELTRQRTKQLRVWIDGLPDGDNLAGSVHMKKK